MDINENESWSSQGGFLDKAWLTLLIAFNVCSSDMQKFVLGLSKVLR